MESKAHLRDFRMAPRKVALVADLVRGKPVGSALNILKFTRKAAAKPMAKLIRSAVAALYVKTISVDQGTTLRRFMPRAMGRASRINKKSSHVHVVLSDAPAGAKRK